MTERGRARSLREVLGASLRLGLTSFGGPIAHLGYFRAEYVVRRRWLVKAVELPLELNKLEGISAAMTPKLRTKGMSSR